MKNINKEASLVHSFSKSDAMKNQMPKLWDAKRPRGTGMTRKENGRSMVEMLGVLAVIGVLSAGALAGYSKAMFQHKMNKTIEEATKIFQRFEELAQKDWGGNEGNDVSVGTYDNSAVQFGLLEKCDSDGASGCRLAVGSVYMDLYQGSSCDAFLGGKPYGQFQFKFTDAKSCVAFAMVHWEKMLPDEWWWPNGQMWIGDVEIYIPAWGETIFPTASEIAETCQTECDNGRCVVYFDYRDYC